MEQAINNDNDNDNDDGLGEGAEWIGEVVGLMG
jgi:hypothetical protein